MRLSKFFRRYSRVLLMFFMSLLLVVFLLGDVLQNARQKMGMQKIKLGQAFGKDIYAADYQAAEARKHLVARMGFAEVESIDTMHYYLLTEEAKRLGVRVSVDDAKSAVAAELSRQGLSADRAGDYLDSLQRQVRVSFATMFKDAGEWLAVRELIEVQGDALGASLPRTELDYRNQTQEAQVKISILDAHAFLSLVPQPTEQELQAFFDEGKARDPNLTEDELQFGYLLPDRVRIEYLTCDPKKMEPRVRLKEKEIQAYFDEHAATYTKRVTPPATQPGGQPPAPTNVPMTFDEARDRVRQDARTDKAIKEAQNLVNEARHEAYQPWQLLPRDPAGFRDAPPGEPMSFEALCDKFRERGELVCVKTDLLSETNLSQLFETRPEFILRQTGTTEPAYQEGRAEVTLSELALRVKGLFKPAPNDTGLVLNLEEPSPVLIGKTQSPNSWKLMPYQAYFFRDVEIQPKGPPASLDAVREKVTDDYKLLKAQEMAGHYAEQLAQQARISGLAAAVNAVPELKERLEAAEQMPELAGPELPPFPPPPKYVQSLGPTERGVTRKGSLPGLSGSQKVQHQTFVLAQAAATQPAEAHAVAVVQVANQYKWAVVELQSVKPLYSGEFAQQRAKLERESRSTEQMDLLKGWVAPASVSARTGFVPAAGSREEREETEQ